MRISRQSTCGVFWFVIIFLLSHTPARAEVSILVSGISVITGGKISQAEKSAYDDALYKAYLEIALRHAPSSSAVDLAQKLKGFAASRGEQDIIQYQIVSKSQQDKILYMNLDLRINDAPLKEWLQYQAFTTPLGLRPLILLSISSKGPGPSEKSEWWSSATPKGYSAFESQLANRLRSAGENVAELPKHINVLPAGPDRAPAMAAALGAGLVVSGSIVHKAVDAVNLDTRIDIALIDAKSRQKIFIFTMSLRGNTDARTMNEILITAFLDQLRAEIAKKVVVVSPVLREKSLCINDIRDYDTYQSMMNSLRSMDTVTKIAISRVHGHSICHNIMIKGNLQDIMDNLKKKQISPLDIAVDEDSATIRLLTQ